MSSRFSSNSKASASKLLENLEDIFPQWKSSITYWCVTVARGLHYTIGTFDLLTLLKHFPGKVIEEFLCQNAALYKAELTISILKAPFHIEKPPYN